MIHPFLYIGVQSILFHEDFAGLATLADNIDAGGKIVGSNALALNIEVFCYSVRVVRNDTTDSAFLGSAVEGNRDVYISIIRMPYYSDVAR